MSDGITNLARAAMAEVKAGDMSAAAAAPALRCDVANWNEADIPPRPWVVPGFLMRGAVTVLSGPGGVAKSSLACAWAMSLATGTPFGRFRPVWRSRVIILNAEDNADEQRMRLSAALKPAGMLPEDMGGRVMRLGAENLATLVTHDAKGGSIGVTQANAELESSIATHRPDVVFLDPLVELHTADENANTALRQVLAHFRAMAQRHNMAVVLIHHSKKGSGAAPGDQDTLRGASAIVGAARIVFTVTGMTAAEAEQFGLAKGAERSFLRVDGAKANYSAVSAAEWFERQPRILDNGEAVAAIVPWEPPAKAGGSPEVMAELLAGIAAGSPAGPYATRLSSDVRSIRGLFEKHGIGPGAQPRMLRAIMEGHGVVVAAYRGSGRKPADGLRTADGLPADAPWLDRPARGGSAAETADLEPVH